MNFAPIPIAPTSAADGADADADGNANANANANAHANANADAGWQMDKLGRWVDPLSTCINGSKTVHAVWSGVRHGPCVGGGASDAVTSDIVIESLDAAVVSPSTAALIPTGAFNAGEDGEPHPGSGGHWNLFNNA
jgi:hypothetical protein